MNPVRQDIAELRAAFAGRPSDPTTLDTLLAAFTALGYALSARALLLLTLLGAFVLALRADTSMGLMVLIAYCAATVLPVVVLEIRKVRS